MEINEDVSTRPSIGFPLGLALLLLVLFCMSGLFCCCVHWDKLRSILFSSSSSSSSQHVRPGDVESDGGGARFHYHDRFIHAHHMKSKEEELGLGIEKMVPVLMPGDEFPKFIAMACPCHPPHWENLVLIQVHKPITFHVMSSPS